MEKKVLLIGAGPMAVDYAKVLVDMKVPFITVGNTEKSAAEFKEKTGQDVILGGIKNYLNENKEVFPKVINAAPEHLLGEVTIDLINAGYKDILVEKPGGKNYEDVKMVAKTANTNDAKVYVGYNRRFFASVEKAKEIIKEDGGVTSFYFEFTEWSHIIGTLKKGEGVLEEWFLHNSSHIIDLAFYLGGKPKNFSTYTSGSLAWHPSGSVFTGAGVTDSGALFSYNANWEAPGRWVVEILTRKHRLLFKPVEKLQIQKIGSVAVEFLEIDDKTDTDFKPGLHKQVENYYNDKYENISDINEQLTNIENYYSKICKGSK
ncbi:MAG: Gfo/Idh/MocA family oxidoreductase [Ignavibacteria bacterium]|nr:Gfo/Idh/MocA family oxidoreductase [Ignavibacteria bacterium]